LYFKLVQDDVKDHVSKNWWDYKPDDPRFVNYDYNVFEGLLGSAKKHVALNLNPSKSNLPLRLKLRTNSPVLICLDLPDNVYFDSHIAISVNTEFSG
jgi:hypothetical protein